MAAVLNPECLEAVLAFGPRQSTSRRPADTPMPYLLEGRPIGSYLYLPRIRGAVRKPFIDKEIYWPPTAQYMRMCTVQCGCLSIIPCTRGRCSKGKAGRRIPGAPCAVPCPSAVSWNSGEAREGTSPDFLLTGAYVRCRRLGVIAGNEVTRIMHLTVPDAVCDS